MLQSRTEAEEEDPVEILRLVRQTAREAQQRALKLQNQTTQQLVQRVRDLKYWAGEIDRERQELREESDLLRQYGHKLALCVGIVADAARVNEACFAARRKRTHVDSGEDRVDAALECEKEAIGQCQQQLREFGQALGQQLDTNDEAHRRLVRDYTLKQEAVSLDHRAAEYGVEYRSSRKATPSGGEIVVAEPWPLQRMSDYQEWVENTAHNLNQAAKARAKSRKLIQRMLSHAKEMARQLRVAANAVDAAVKESMRHWTEWRDAVGAQLSAKERELRVADAAVAEIQSSLHLASNPLQVALARFAQRGLRPGIEHCNDKAQHALQAELNHLKSATIGMEQHLEKAKEGRRKLEADRFRLQRKLDICEQNVAVDLELTRQIRTQYPQEVQLSGFLVGGELPKPPVVK